MGNFPSVTVLWVINKAILNMVRKALTISVQYTFLRRVGLNKIMGYFFKEFFPDYRLHMGENTGLETLLKSQKNHDDKSQNVY